MKVLINCITHDIKTFINDCLMQNHWINDFSNCITDDLTTCNNAGLRQKSVYLCLARLHEVQKSYCSHPGRTRSRSRSTLLKFSRSLYLGNHSSESIHTWTIGTQ